MSSQFSTFLQLPHFPMEKYVSLARIHAWISTVVRIPATENICLVSDTSNMDVSLASFSNRLQTRLSVQFFASLNIESPSYYDYFEVIQLESELYSECVARVPSDQHHTLDESISSSCADPHALWIIQYHQSTSHW